MRKLLFAAVLLLLCGVLAFGVSAKDFTIGMLVKNVGNPFFEACARGGQEACDELGNTFIFQGPPTPTVEGQIEIIENFIAQNVDAICVSANDFNALVPVLKKAMANGIKVVSFDSAVNPQGRIVHVNQADAEQIGRLQVQAIAEMIGYEGEIAILSAAATMTNQNTWIRWMQEELKDPKYSKMRLAAIVYGDDLRDKSYNEAMGLFKSYPNLKGIISPTTVGISATAKAITDAGLIGKIKLTGLGLPSEMAEWVKNGACEAFYLWNPVDLGYLAAYVAGLLCEGTITGKEGETFTAGRLGERTITKAEDGGTEVLLGPPFRFDASNIDEWKDVF
ncbi:MAG: rhamnose transport system substrate-binding protein [Candidatus Atribacteria bacterium]|jgi:rhamnose transport system substrate-binding protein|uniref:Rhamnose ABC transporter substrate-binding protein n=1 Tax=Thermatribacter velox TaxID=3039681 RepID=A0ABZ2YBC3_9BACT|nr:rhamnose transport system substrate-binding protein [Candidatus Atribacteria bacterium]MDI3531091.1 rhamnose transport system substrate-binding protein [Candidatus Atribacteria bacterium]